MCEICHKVPYTELACISGVYNLSLEDWKYVCHSCNMKSDHANGRIPTLLEGRRYALAHFMSGSFHTRFANNKRRSNEYADRIVRTLKDSVEEECEK